jgi:serine/threonine protein kinase
VSIFAVGEKGTPATTEAAAVQFCISIEEPSLSLQGVVDGMLASEDCQTDPTVRQRYAEKVFAVLRLVAKGLRHLHALALVHGSVDAMNCAKYGNRWKLRNVLGIKRIGQSVDFDVGSDGSSSSEMLPAADVWAFGKLSFEILVGEPLYSVVDRQKQLDDWDRAKQTFQEILLQVRVIPSGADLILSCLNPVPSLRPTMSDVLRNAFWKSCKREVESKSMNLLPFVD